jgi:hypothetical protein
MEKITDKQMKELQKLQAYFVNRSFENSCRMFRLIALQLLAAVSDANSLQDIEDEARRILDVFGDTTKGLE